MAGRDHLLRKKGSKGTTHFKVPTKKNLSQCTLYTNKIRWVHLNEKLLYKFNRWIDRWKKCGYSVAECRARFILAFCIYPKKGTDYWSFSQTAPAPPRVQKHTASQPPANINILYHIFSPCPSFFTCWASLVGRGRADPVLDFGGHRHEGLLDVGRVLGLQQHRGLYIFSQIIFFPRPLFSNTQRARYKVNLNLHIYKFKF